MKVFLDTNVLVAAFATRGLCEDLFRTVLAEHELVVSKHVLTELGRVLRDKLRLPPDRVRQVMAFLESEASVIRPKAAAAWPPEDPDDQWIVAAAIEAGVDAFVTGDKELLAPPDEILVLVVSPREFWEKLR